MTHLVYTLANYLLPDSHIIFLFENLPERVALNLFLQVYIKQIVIFGLFFYTFSTKLNVFLFIKLC